MPYPSRLSNDLIRALEHADGNCQTDLFCRLKVNDKLELRCLLDWEIGRLRSL
jgi:hypothetical protein